MNQSQGLSTAVVVLGMHRAGTSLTMAAVEALGVESGDHLLPPGPDNETGYWEDRSILALNERLLHALDKSWFSLAPIDTADWSRPVVRDLHHEAVGLLKRRFGEATLWGFKDPRTLRLLPFWQDVLAEVNASVKYVVAFRNPDSVAASLLRRNQFAHERGCQLWLTHYLPYLDRLLGADCHYVNYDRLVDDPHETVRAMEHFLRRDHGCPTSDDDGRLEEFFASTLRQSLRHTQIEDADGASVSRLLRDTYELLVRLATAGTHAVSMTEIEALQSRYHEDAWMLRQLDDAQSEAERLGQAAREEEPIRDKIEKMGLYQADLHRKLEWFDERLGSVQAKVAAQTDEVSSRLDLLSGMEARLEDVQEAVVVQIDEMSRRSERQMGVLAELDGRVEDIQERIVVQIDELHRVIAALQNPQAPRGTRISELPRDRADAEYRLESLYLSTSWRITKPLRGAKMLLRRMWSELRR